MITEAKMVRQHQYPAIPTTYPAQVVGCAQGIETFYVRFSSVRMDESRVVDTRLGRGAGAVSRGRMITIHLGRTTPWSWMNDLRVAELGFRERPSIGVRLNFEAIPS